MPKSKRQPVHSRVELENDDETPLKVVVSAIHKVSDGIDKINESGLTERAIILLLHDATKVSKSDIKKVLEAAPLLAERYTRNPDED